MAAQPQREDEDEASLISTLENLGNILILKKVTDLDLILILNLIFSVLLNLSSTLETN